MISHLLLTFDVNSALFCGIMLSHFYFVFLFVFWMYFFCHCFVHMLKNLIFSCKTTLIIIKRIATRVQWLTLQIIPFYVSNRWIRCWQSCLSNWTLVILSYSKWNVRLKFKQTEFLSSVFELTIHTSNATMSLLILSVYKFIIKIASFAFTNIKLQCTIIY